MVCVCVTTRPTGKQRKRNGKREAAIDGERGDDVIA